MSEIRGERAARNALGPVDVLGLAVAGLATIALWIVQLAVVPTFARMFDDFGGELPALTQAIVGASLAALVTTVVLCLVGLGIVLRLARGGALGSAAIGLAGLIAIACVPLTIYGLYLPIFAIR